MRKLATFLRTHRAALVLLAGELAALALFYLLRGSQAVMDRWLDTVSMPVKWAVSAVVDPLPFSACEAGATALIVLFLVLLGRAVWQAAHKRFAPLGAWVLHFAATALGLYVLVCALWGTQYYGTGFAQKAGMTAGPVSTKDLADVTMYFGMKVNELAQQVPRDENGVFAVEDRTILQSAAPIYDGLTEEYPFLQSPTRTPKPAFYSKLMSAAGFTGYLCPVVGESTLNVDCPTMFLPVTVAHELAHQRGVAAEQEANYVGIRAATTCDDVIYQYPAGCSATCTCPMPGTAPTRRQRPTIFGCCAGRPAPTLPPTMPTGPAGKARSKKPAKRCTPPFWKITGKIWA